MWIPSSAFGVAHFKWSTTSHQLHLPVYSCTQARHKTLFLFLAQNAFTAHTEIGTHNIFLGISSTPLHFSPLLLPFPPLLFPSPPLRPPLHPPQVQPSCMVTGSPSTTERHTRYLPATVSFSIMRVLEEVSTSTGTRQSNAAYSAVG